MFRLTEFEDFDDAGVVKVKGFLILHGFYRDHEAYDTMQSQ